ncbi:chitosanase [Streptomyces sp. NPDC048590]|uniref:chitosanase n=1 Tax=Streptomyces sp. NPDC048590 TaxID=3365574 RepID=UPI0037130D54
MHHPHTRTSRRTTRIALPTRIARITRTAGLAAVALGLTFTAVPVTAHAGAPTPSAAHLEAAATGLDDPAKKEIAMQLVSSAENSSLDWKAQYGYIEDIGDGRGYTAGIIGFCSGTGDMLDLVELYTQRRPDNVLADYLPALRQVDGTDSHDGLDPGFPGHWREAASDSVFQQAQNDERDRVYFDPAVSQGKADGLGTLGQFAYYDALVMHGGGTDSASFGSIRQRALAQASPPSQGGDEVAYLDAFLDARVWAMKQEEAHSDTSRVDTAQRVFLRAGNLDLDPPLDWKVYGDSFHIG